MREGGKVRGEWEKVKGREGKVREGGEMREGGQCEGGRGMSKVLVPTKHYQVIKPCAFVVLNICVPPPPPLPSLTPLVYLLTSTHMAQVWNNAPPPPQKQTNKQTKRQKNNLVAHS